jgi:hypothetical protein
MFTSVETMKRKELLRGCDARGYEFLVALLILRIVFKQHREELVRRQWNRCQAANPSDGEDPRKKLEEPDRKMFHVDELLISHRRLYYGTSLLVPLVASANNLGASTVPIVGS